MFANFAAIHTTTMVRSRIKHLLRGLELKRRQSLSNVMFNLAARQEYIQPLREEIETAIRADGWTKEAMGHMHKLDSFIKESMRLAGIINGKLLRSKTAAHHYIFAFSRGSEEGSQRLYLFEWSNDT